MKNIDRYLLYILLGLVLGLYILYFSKFSTERAASKDPAVENAAIENKPGLIYYVNTDTVWEKYDLVKEAMAVMSKRKDQYEGQLQREARDFEQEVNEFQTRSRSMSEVEMQIKQKDLMRKESELSKLRDELELKMMKEEKDWNDRLRGRIVDHIDQVTKDRRYDYILGYSITSNIILANDSLDITDEILETLNKEYETEKSRGNADR